MKQSTILFLFLKLYSLIWKLALPILKRNHRLRQGMAQRLSCSHLGRSDIWIQGASAGESYLTVTLVNQLVDIAGSNPNGSTCPEQRNILQKILLTSTTSQGMDILHQGISRHTLNRHQTHCRSEIKMETAWFPFDIPELMDHAISRMKPKLIVLLETELWPALLAAAKKQGVRVLIINGRLSAKSHGNYMKTKQLWRPLAPDAILATSSADAERFRDIFPKALIDVMPNIKFDTMLKTFDPPSNPDSHLDVSISSDKNRHGDCHGDLRSYILRNNSTFSIPISIFASIRQQEEEDILHILPKFLEAFPNQIVLIFPRHMHRIEAWKKALCRLNHKYEHGYCKKTCPETEQKQGKQIQWQLRSQITPPPSPTTVILWDTFGELKDAYAIASTAFVGGSLKPLGGHNFIEPLISGTPTVTGPFLDDFAWVGEDIFKTDIICKAENREAVLCAMLSYLNHPLNRNTVMEKGFACLRTKQGGSIMACNMINSYLSQNGMP